MQTFLCDAKHSIVYFNRSLTYVRTIDIFVRYYNGRYYPRKYTWVGSVISIHKTATV